MALDRPIWAIKSALAEDKKEYLRIMATHYGRRVGEEEEKALQRLTVRMKQCEDALRIIEEFGFKPNPGS